MALTAKQEARLVEIKTQRAAIEKELGVGQQQGFPPADTEGAPLETATDPRQAIGRALETIPELGGMIAGGSKAAQVLGPRGKLLGGLGRIAGSALGAGMGEEVEIAGKQALGLEAPSTFKGNLEAFGKAAATGGIAETLGLGIGLSAAPIKKLVFDPIKGTAIKGARGINKSLKRYNTSLLNSQATTSTALDIMDNVFRGSFVTAGEAGRLAEANALAGKSMVDDFTQAFLKRADPEEVKTLFATAVVDNKKLNLDIANKLYSGVDRSVNNQARVNLAGLEGSLAGSKAAKKALKRSVDEMEITDLSNLSFEQAAKLRTNINLKFFATEEKAKAITPEAKKIIKSMSKPDGTIDKAMELAATKHDALRLVPGDTTFNQLKEARKAWKDINDTFHIKFIDSILDADPIAGSKLLSGLKDTSQVKEIRAALTSPKGKLDKETFSKVQGSYIQGILNKSKKFTEEVEATGSLEVVGRGLKTALDPKNTSRSVLHEMLGGPAVSKLNKIADSLVLMESKGKTTVGGVATQLLQVGAATGFATGALTGDMGAVATGGALLLTPVGLGKILSSETGRKILLEGLTTDPTKAQIARYVGRVTSFLGSDAVISQEGLLSGEPVKESKADEVPFVQQKPRNNILQQLGSLKGVK